ncbi:MAG TPA: hypothetical protein VNL71_23545 [Chloroflexota bacterium]|nr:hypothetical protein [Chloroflexota bacterium]
MTSTDAGASWAVTSTGFNPAILGVICIARAECLFAAGHGYVFSEHGGQPSLLWNAGTQQDLTAVTCISATHCIFVGGTGTIVVSRSSPITLTSRHTGTDTQLRGIRCPTSTDCLAVGDAGAILVSSNGGDSWARAQSHTTEDL